MALITTLYFIPTVVAYKRMHRNRAAIFALNIFGGWCVVGWVVAIVWASTNDVEASSATAKG
jgi:Superinfection immunity protein